MGRNRIEFPFNPGGDTTFRGNIRFTNSVEFDALTTFTSTSTVIFGSTPAFLFGFSTQASANPFEFVPGTTVLFDAGSVVDFHSVPVFFAGINFGPGTSTLTDYQESIPFTPTVNGFTIVNGTGGVTFSGHVTKIGNCLHYQITATLTGTATLAATAGVSNFTGIPFFPIVYNEANHATDNAGTNYGHGITGSNHVSPTIPATHGAGFIYWSGEGLVS